MVLKIMAVFASSMEAEFGVTPLDKLSLPALAELVMWKTYDDSWGRIFSYPPKHYFINEAMRSAITGGPSIVFCRHAETKLNTNYPKEVCFTPSNDRIACIESFDFNAL